MQARIFSAVSEVAQVGLFFAAGAALIMGMLAIR